MTLQSHADVKVTVAEAEAVLGGAKQAQLSFICGFTHTHTKEGILIINYSNGCLTVNDFQFPVNCGKVFNFKYTEEASNLYEQKTATTANLHSKEENFLKLFI